MLVPLNFFKFMGPDFARPTKVIGKGKDFSWRNSRRHHSLKKRSNNRKARRK